MTLSPPLTPPGELRAQIRASGYAVLDRAGAQAALGLHDDVFGRWASFWSDLPADAHLRDGGRYRRRRHASYVVEGAHVEPVAHRAHWQPLAYNALHGGIERWFEPLSPALASDPELARLLAGLAQHAGALRSAPRWFCEVHQFRIDTTDGIGRPTPEGAHRDGVDLVAVFLVARHNVKGGETRVFDARGPQGVRFTLTEPGSLLLVDDEHVIHESTPIQPIDAAGLAWRDTLVVTLRRGGFLDPRSEPASP
ncbi:MAG TPA: 2OG-Fe dioxygenase family protein [Rubrivivax sp.]|jgi:hypothetical protein|nr:2OG-Fe dioxygenase family protein [Rubrivivax sp.]